MKKQYAVLTLLLFALVIIALFINNNRDIFAYLPPWQETFSLENPSCAITDNRDNLFLIDKSMQRIVKTDPSGDMQFIIRVSELDIEGFSVFEDMTVDAAGNLYVLNMLLDGVNVVAERILHYSPQGKLVRTIYEVEYLEKRPLRPGLLTGLNFHAGYVYFYSVVDDNEVTLQRVSLLSTKHETVYQLTLPDQTYLAEITGVEPGEIYYTTMRAEVFNITASGEHVPIYPKSMHKDRDRVSFPVHIDLDRDRGGAYITDIGLRQIVYLNYAGEAQILLSQDGLGERGFALSLTAAESLKFGQDGSVAVTVRNRVVLLKSGGEFDRVVAHANYPSELIFFRVLVWVAVLLFVSILVMALRLYFIEIRERRISLITKQILVFIPIFIVSMVYVSWVIRQDFDREYEKEIFSKLSFLVHLGSLVIDTERVEQISEPAHYMNEDFRKVNAQNQSILIGNPFLDPEGLYSMLYKVEQDNVYVLMFFYKRVGTYYPMDSDPEFMRVARERHIVTGQFRDADGGYMYAMGPLYSPSGEIIGIHEVGLDTNQYERYKTALFWKSNKTIAWITGLIVAAFLFTIYYMLLSISKLRRGVADLAAGDFNVVVPVKTRDELGELSHGFNVMSGYLRRYIEEIKDLSDAYFRFVPEQFFQFLGKKSILEVELGDQVKEDMCILVVQIRSFNALSKQMTPEENFDFINDFFKKMGPVVRKNNGIVDNYYGGGLRALFPEQADDVLTCAVEMRGELEQFNEQLRFAGKEPVDMGIGIHKGPVMLGIIGEEKRMAGTAISDTVNLASSLQNLTGRLGASILTTADIMEAIDSPEHFPHRSLGVVAIEGVSKGIRLYDIYGGDPVGEQRLKEETQTLFEEGIILYQQGRFFDARTAFVEVLRHNGRDQAAVAYFYACDDYFKTGAPEGWDSTLTPRIDNLSQPKTMPPH